jgi:hypothetical protein
MNAKEEQEAVARILADTKGNPEERERRLNKLADDNAIAAGTICKCQEPGRTFCPRHGRIKSLPAD